MAVEFRFLILNGSLIDRVIRKNGKIAQLKKNFVSKGDLLNQSKFSRCHTGNREVKGKRGRVDSAIVRRRVFARHCTALSCSHGECCGDSVEIAIASDGPA